MSVDTRVSDAAKDLKTRLDLQIEARKMSQKEKDRKEKESLAKSREIAREFKAALAPYLHYIRTVARGLRKQGISVRVKKKFRHVGLTQTYRSRHQLVSCTRGYNYYSYKENDREGGPQNEYRDLLSGVDYIVERHNTFVLELTLSFSGKLNDRVIELYPAAKREIYALINGYGCKSLDHFKLRVIEFTKNH